ncbi:CLUMA_CG002951, isoform A [Clunio marinus]|uniref:CLUMA_CG002951, isoform A n=1 Tax=Clunio marinus TaxID=568069 RepID=A0A1J1HMA8_9DIPT|nr:CLUMA_CG002951, isoform A [Clunio marinus]
MKKLCICRDPFSFFFGSVRQQTECTLDYNTVEDAKRTERKKKTKHTSPEAFQTLEMIVCWLCFAMR